MPKDGDELVKYVAEQLLNYMETPREVRKQAREYLKEIREPWTYRWFGMMPAAIRMWTEKLRIKK
ncbi:YqzE family protein [Paenibacillus piri]|uniref:YqzE family protein n=1 Tax=Paenibacillus piri TaxID=2547395 RepID=A0A4R5KK46_9BACL|nr:YqzE family protein [Paenibacillus piri]TDF95911.1 YqzE family protein [Paenibacillus piri]